MESYYDRMIVAVNAMRCWYNELNLDNTLDVEFDSELTQRLITIHDYLHILMGLGFSSSEEDIIADVEQCIMTGYHYNPEIVALVSALPVEYIAICKQ